jgi:hypothetical protein
VDDVEAAGAEREREVRAHAHRYAHAAAAGDRQRRSERDHVRLRAVEEDAATGREIACAVRRREHRDRVPQRAEAARDAVHVLVDVVWLRPGERRDEADAQAHPRPSVLLV